MHFEITFLWLISLRNTVRGHKSNSCQANTKPKRIKSPNEKMNRMCWDSGCKGSEEKPTRSKQTPFLHPHTDTIVSVSLHTRMCTRTVITCGLSRRILLWELRLTLSPDLSNSWYSSKLHLHKFCNLVNKNRLKSQGRWKCWYYLSPCTLQKAWKVYELESYTANIFAFKGANSNHSLIKQKKKGLWRLHRITESITSKSASLNQRPQGNRQSNTQLLSRLHCTFKINTVPCTASKKKRIHFLQLHPAPTDMFHHHYSVRGEW